MTSVLVHIIWHCQTSTILSDPAEHLEKGSNSVHAVEKVQRDGKIENRDPYAEAECLLFQPIVVLWPAAEGGEDPQLKERNKLHFVKTTSVISASDKETDRTKQIL